ncbi:extracellular solute-binding protein [Streptomyces sp. 4N509B]|uniref:extracellular solute-binding protein n=1 Tax=Streptomyces sp. 4N509B TaxID=3457413 RepID=UPI003FCF4DAA
MLNSRPGPSRRRFLAATGAAAAAAVGGVPLLSACGGEGSGQGEGRVSERELRSILPTYQASESAVEPDIPAPDGASPGFTRWIPDEELGVTVPEPRSSGEFTAMTPLWGTAPRPGNAFWTVMDEAIGARMEWRTQDGETYGEKLGATLASSDIPDLVCIPAWEMHGQIPQAIANRFADLGPYLSGDRVLDYPNLAAIPTVAWQSSVFGGALRGLPMPQPTPGDIVPYYRQDIFDANGWTPPTSAQEFYDFCVDVTSPRNRVWASENMKWLATKMFGVLPDKPSYWKQENGRLVHKLETEEYVEAMEWARTLYAAGVIHPDAVAGAGDAGTRFAAGESLMYFTGDGSWYDDSAAQRATNPDFHMNGFDYFAHDGGEPTLWARMGASIWTFVNKNLSEDRIRAALHLADFTAAPYGTVEQRLHQYGVRGTHYTLEDGLPLRTEQGTREVVPGTYTFICSAADVIAYPDMPQVVEDYTSWQQRNLPFFQEPMFFGLQIQEPARLANLNDPFEDMEDDIIRGRQSLRDFRNAVDEWRRNGGDELRDFYQQLLDEGRAGGGNA